MSRWIFRLEHESKRTVKYAENDKECYFEVGLPGVSMLELMWRKYHKLLLRMMCVLIDLEIILTPKGIVCYKVGPKLYKWEIRIKRGAGKNIVWMERIQWTWSDKYQTNWPSPRSVADHTPVCFSALPRCSSQQCRIMMDAWSLVTFQPCVCPSWNLIGPYGIQSETVRHVFWNV